MLIRISDCNLDMLSGTIPRTPATPGLLPRFSLSPATKLPLAPEVVHRLRPNNNSLPTSLPTPHRRNSFSCTSSGPSLESGLEELAWELALAVLVLGWVALG